jgi:ribonuclease III
MAKTPFEQRLGFTFRDRKLLEQALTHKSVINEQPSDTRGHNERLEFLGDAIVGTAVADELYRAFPEATEGSLTFMRAELVRREGLARWARRFGLGAEINLGRGEEANGGREKDSLLASTFEAVIGALYLDRGYSAVRALVGPLVVDAVPELAPTGRSRDAKSELQYQLQTHRGALPTYTVVSVTGPEHEPHFTVEAVATDLPPVRGEGASKQSAEQAAAARALQAWRLGADAAEDAGTRHPPR